MRYRLSCTYACVTPSAFSVQGPEDMCGKWGKGLGEGCGGGLDEGLGERLGGELGGELGGGLVLRGQIVTTEWSRRRHVCREQPLGEDYGR